MTELELQAMVADYLRLRYPNAIFHSDFGSGIKLSIGQAIKQKRLNGGRRSWPDLFIAEPRTVLEDDGERHAYCGLFLELKKPGVKIYTQNGELVANEHIREQAEMLMDLRARGYAAEFGIGFEATKKLIDDYMKGRYAHVD